MSFCLKKNQKQEIHLTYNFKLIVRYDFCVCEICARNKHLKSFDCYYSFLLS